VSSCGRAESRLDSASHPVRAIDHTSLTPTSDQSFSVEIILQNEWSEKESNQKVPIWEKFQNFETGSLEGCPKFGEDGDSDLNIPPPPAKPVLNVNNKLRLLNIDKYEDDESMMGRFFYRNKSISLPTRLDLEPEVCMDLNGSIARIPRCYKRNRNSLTRYICPAIASIFAVSATIVVTSSVLFWNYSETVQRRMTKKQSLILDHWGKSGPLVVDPAMLEALGNVADEDQILRRDMGFPADALPKPLQSTNQIRPKPYQGEHLSGTIQELRPAILELRPAIQELRPAIQELRPASSEDHTAQELLANFYKYVWNGHKRKFINGLKSQR